MRRLFVAAAAVGLVAAGASADWNEMGDAGELAATAQQTGSGILHLISGMTNSGGGDYCDAYLINIVDVDAFYATTSPNDDGDAICSWDSRLFLFTPDGQLLLGNDDTPSPGLQSYISDPSTYPGVLFNSPPSLSAGQYVLVITGYSNEPYDVNSTAIMAMSSDFDALHGVIPGSLPFDHWEDASSIGSGEYTIALNGVMGVPGPGALALLGLAGLLGRRRR
jgi:hypothetical protein